MKLPFIAMFLCLLGITFIFFVKGCDLNTNPDMDIPELMNLEFTHSTYAEGQPLILWATPNPEIEPEFYSENRLTLDITSSNGAATTTQLSPWSDLSDDEMVDAINDGPGNASIRVKETDRESARNSEGELIRSEEAMNNFINWVEDHKDLSVIWVSQLHPDVHIEFLVDPTAELVNQIRTHENVEFMEPDQYVIFESGAQESNSSEVIVAVIRPGDSFTYSAGEAITAEFHQSDGTVIRASTSITE